MNKTRLWIVLVALAATALACNAVTGIGLQPAPTPTDSVSVPATDDAPANEPTTDSGSGNGNSYNTEFPLPDDVSNFMELGGGIISFQTKMSLTDLLAFYQDSFGKEGYTERKLLTVTTDATFNLVFDGHTSGKAIVIQGVDLGSGTSNITIRLEAID